MSATLPANATGGITSFLWSMRPAQWPMIAAHALVGWLLAIGSRPPDRLAWAGIAVWVILLNGGAAALGAAFAESAENDGRKGRFSSRALVAIALMAAGYVLALSQPATYQALYLICAVMLVLRVVPPVRLKSIAGADLVLNMLRFGTLTPYAGWALSGRPLHGPLAAVLWAFTPLFGALYPLAQLHQIEADRARGDHTFAVRVGPNAALSAALFCASLAFGMFAMAAWRSSWTDQISQRWGVLTVAGLAWATVLGPWARNAGTWSSGEHQRAVYHALAAWALTDIAVLLAWAG